MYCYVDESGNTGNKLFDPAQPVLYYGLITSKTNLGVSAEPLLRSARARLDVERLHANDLGVGRLSKVALSLGRFALKRDVRFSLYKVVKPDHAIITFFDQVFDTGVNKAVRCGPLLDTAAVQPSFSKSLICSTRRPQKPLGRHEWRPTRHELQKLWGAMRDASGPYPSPAGCSLSRADFWRADLGRSEPIRDQLRRGEQGQCASDLSEPRRLPASASIGGRPGSEAVAAGPPDRRGPADPVQSGARRAGRHLSAPSRPEASHGPRNAGDGHDEW